MPDGSTASFPLSHSQNMRSMYTLPLASSCRHPHQQHREKNQQSWSTKKHLHYRGRVLPPLSLQKNTLFRYSPQQQETAFNPEVHICKYHCQRLGFDGQLAEFATVLKFLIFTTFSSLFNVFLSSSPTVGSKTFIEFQLKYFYVSFTFYIFLQSNTRHSRLTLRFVTLDLPPHLYPMTFMTGLSNLISLYKGPMRL